MTTTELKAQAYDILAQIEYLQRMLSETNQKIAELQQNEKNNPDTASADKYSINQ